MTEGKQIALRIVTGFSWTGVDRLFLALHESLCSIEQDEKQQNEKVQKSSTPWQVSKDGDAFTISAPLITSSQSTPASLSLISCCIFDETDASNCKLPHFYFRFR